MTDAHVTRALILGVVGLGVVGALALRPSGATPVVTAAVVTGAPRLLELGSTSCVSCKAMHEELALLRAECGPSIAVEEIDVWRDEAAAERYGVKTIPTQIFFDPAGRELERHVGFLPRREIRARFASRGMECRP